MSSLLLSSFLLSQAISLDVQARPLREVLQALSTPSERLLADASLAGEIVVVRVKSLSRQQMKEQLALVFHAEWQERDGGNVLLRSPAKVQELRELAQRFTTEKLSGQLKKQSVKQAMLGPLDRANAFVAAVDQLERDMSQAGPNRGVSLDGPRLASPATFLLIDLLNAIGPDEIVRQTQNTTAVWASPAGAEQLPLPASTHQHLLTFSESEARLMTLLDERIKQQGASSVYADVLTSAEKGKDVGKVILSARPSGNSYFFGLTLYDKAGSTKVWAFTSTYHLDPTPTKGLPASLLPLTGEAAEFLERLSARITVLPGEVAQPSKQLLDWLSMPTKRDPHLLGPSQGILALARDRDVVAWVPERALSSARIAFQDRNLELGRLEADLSQSCDLKKTDTLLTVSLKPHVVSSYRSLDRQVLQDYLVSLHANQGVSLRRAARFHYRAGAAANGSVATLVRQVAEMPYAASSFFSMGAWPDFLNFVGSLNDTQWSALEAGTALSVRNLAKEQRDLAHSFFMGLTYSAPDVSLTDLQKNTLEILPGRSSEGVLVSMKKETPAAIRSVGETGFLRSYGVGRFLTPQGIAQTVFAWSANDKSWTIDRAMNGRYELGDYERYEFRVELERGLAATYAIEGAYRNGKGAYEWKDLPREFRAETERRFKQYRENTGGAETQQ